MRLGVKVSHYKKKMHSYNSKKVIFLFLPFRIPNSDALIQHLPILAAAELIAEWLKNNPFEEQRSFCPD